MVIEDAGRWFTLAALVLVFLAIGVRYVFSLCMQYHNNMEIARKIGAAGMASNQTVSHRTEFLCVNVYSGDRRTKLLVPVDQIARATYNQNRAGKEDETPTYDLKLKNEEMYIVYGTLDDLRTALKKGGD